ncbi:MAG: NAD(P)/FAD-dependent oxidoreductase [Candidatus Omnitrophota bacterium]
MDYDVAVIGAGIGGVTAAYFLAQEGKRVILFERGPRVGGYATTFKRKGFTFESSIHCVDDLADDGDFATLLADSGLWQKVTCLPAKSFARVIYPEHDFILDGSKDTLFSYFKSTFPEQSKNFDRLSSALDRFYAQFDTFRDSRIPDWINFLLAPLRFPSFLSLSKKTVEEYLSAYITDAKARALFANFWHFLGLPPSQLSAFFFFLAFRGYYCDKPHYIQGGFSRLLEGMVEGIKVKGGQVRFNTSVSSIISEDQRANGVLTEAGECFFVPAIISNVNALDTLTKMPIEESIKKNYLAKLTSIEKSISGVQVYLGLSVPAASLGMNSPMFFVNATYDHDATFACATREDYEHCLLEIVDHAQIDSTLAPVGKGTLAIMTCDLYEHWATLPRHEYEVKKEAVGRKLIERVERLLPGLSKAIEVIEVATPLTMERYTRAPSGALYGFAATVDQVGPRRLDRKTKMKGLYLAGAWTQPGHGAHACFLSGYLAAQEVCTFLGSKKRF